MNYHYIPTFNAREFGPAEKRADRYWEERKRCSEDGGSGVAGNAELNMRSGVRTIAGYSSTQSKGYAQGAEKH